jgi:uncharacterized protein YdaU (DUF1376 family)
MNYFPFHIGDYAAHTRHLSRMEDLAYRRLLDLYYIRETPLPDAPQCARLIDLADLVTEVESVLADFFVKTDAGWIQSRCDKEIAKYKKMGTGGLEGANKRWGKGAYAPPIATPSDPPMPTKNQEPRTKNQEKTEKAPAAPRGRRCPVGWAVPPDAFEAMANECPGLNLDLESAKFRDWEFKTPRSDWSAAWRTWMRKAFENLASKPTGETSYARSMREKYEQVTPLIAAKAPGPKPNPMDVIEGMTRDPLRIAR